MTGDGGVGPRGALAAGLSRWAARRWPGRWRRWLTQAPRTLRAVFAVFTACSKISRSGDGRRGLLGVVARAIPHRDDSRYDHDDEKDHHRAGPALRGEPQMRRDPPRYQVLQGNQLPQPRLRPGRPASSPRVPQDSNSPGGKSPGRGGSSLPSWPRPAQPPQPGAGAPGRFSTSIARCVITVKARQTHDLARTELVSSSRGSGPSPGRAFPGTRRGPRPPRRSCRPAGWPRPRTPAGRPGRRR